MIKLGSTATDTATGLKGMVTLMQVDLDRHLYYAFQPRQLNPETGEPVDSYWLVEERLKGFDSTPDVPMPLEVLGTEVEDTATGFKGTAVDLALHISGCVHVTIQPKGVQARSGERIKGQSFDIRRCKGKAIKPMAEQEREQDQRAKPSPGPARHYDPSQR